MIRRQKESNYQYKHPLGTIVTDATVGVSATGRRSLAADEIQRLSRLSALQFLEKNYRSSIEDSNFELTSDQVRAIIALLHVNQSEFGKLIGCQKSKVSKILCGKQRISKSQAQLAIERLAMELARPNSCRKILGDASEEIGDDQAVQEQLDKLRYGT